MKKTLLIALTAINASIMMAEDAETIIVKYDDLGNKDKSPSLTQGKHLANWRGKDSPEYSVAHDPEKLVLNYENLDPKLKYGVTVTTLSTGKRVQKLLANGKLIYDNYAPPAKPEKKTHILPNDIIGEDQKLTLEFVKIAGSNVVVSEVTLFSVGANSGEIVKKKSMKTTPTMKKATK